MSADRLKASALISALRLRIMGRRWVAAVLVSTASMGACSCGCSHKARSGLCAALCVGSFAGLFSGAGTNPTLVPSNPLGLAGGLFEWGGWTIRGNNWQYG